MNNSPRKIESASNPNIKPNTKDLTKKYYTIFFSILIISFFAIYWLCNFTKLR